MRCWTGVLICLCSLLLAPTARGDGGQVRFSEKRGGYQVTVFTQPTPFRAGPVDISVFVQDAETGSPIADVEVRVRATRRERKSETIECVATAAAATNKLFRAAVFDLPAAGWWDVLIDVAGARESAALQFAVEADEPPPRWQTLWPWFTWPLVVIVLFVLRMAFPSRRGAQAGASA